MPKPLRRPEGERQPRLLPLAGQRARSCSVSCATTWIRAAALPNGQRACSATMGDGEQRRGMMRAARRCRHVSHHVATRPDATMSEGSRWRVVPTCPAPWRWRPAASRCRWGGRRSARPRSSHRSTWRSSMPREVARRRSGAVDRRQQEHARQVTAPGQQRRGGQARRAASLSRSCASRAPAVQRRGMRLMGGRLRAGWLGFPLPRVARGLDTDSAVKRLPSRCGRARGGCRRVETRR
jgi:hypothetical protein